MLGHRKIDTLTTMRFRILLLAVVLAVPVAATAQVFGTVRIVVRVQQNLAVSGGSVSRKAAASSWTQAAVTDAQGEALFPAVTAGQYVISVSATGFEAAARTIVVSSNAVTPVTVQ